MPRFVLNQAAIQQMFQAGGAVWTQVDRNLGSRVLVLARAYAPVGETGKLRNSLRKETVVSVRSLSTYVYSDLEYAAAVHEGTRPHTIARRDGGLMAFDVGGRTVFTRSVNHPGAKANPFLRRALETTMAATV